MQYLLRSGSVAVLRRAGARSLAIGAASVKRDVARLKIAEIDSQSAQVAPQLIDAFNREHDYLRISLTEKCNLRCFYCMPEDGVELSPPQQLLTDDEVVHLAELFVRAGVRKLRLTGGEPTVRRNIVELVGRLSGLRDLGLQSIGMTSNGLALHRKLPDLVENGLTHLNLSLDTLDQFKFELITRRRGHDAVVKSLDTALSLPGLQSVKLNVVVVKGLNDSEVFDFVEMTKERPLSVRFIEFMPFTGNKWDKAKMVPSGDLLHRIASRYPNVRKAEDSLNDTARSYEIPGHRGSIAFISSMSDHFCGTCNRLRITADGNIKVCLFGPNEVSLRDALRSGATEEELMGLIGMAVGRKKARHAGPIFSPSPRRLCPPSRLLIPTFPLWTLTSSPKHRHSTAEHSTFMHTSAVEAAERSEGPKLSHVDASGRPAMVDVTDKPVTSRTAIAQGRIYLNQIAFDLVTDPGSVTGPASELSPVTTDRVAKALSKGPVLLTAELAGIQAAKRTSSLIPLCHPLPLTHVSITLSPEQDDDSRSGSRWIQCVAKVRCDGKTGVEMEALTAVSVSLLTVWDMLKAVAGAEMEIGDVRVVHKQGGKSGDFLTPGEPSA
ncbi:molybdenum cofactor biosynthesis prote [Dacryopinax primogenitus]|uniref:Molybdenum cofactor biosynthesis prote n=1 Tax=Dacryopinax primogenitus (strain DJM 731) TaxID=1858805 RepID=M5G349_DACPD|nr:molybdenum cofactor biosynthesis prote [Dacryopinax primogenitus]EJU02645.1 molybdenum cofactor biosynthesis prote [Dacryopinax primogenitus]